MGCTTTKEDQNLEICEQTKKNLKAQEKVLRYTYFDSEKLGKRSIDLNEVGKPLL